VCIKESLDEIPIENPSDAMHRTGFQKVITICITTPGTEAKSCVVEDKIVWLAQKVYANSTTVVQAYKGAVLSNVV
jgi:hypothetical protein